VAGFFIICGGLLALYLWLDSQNASTSTGTTSGDGVPDPSGGGDQSGYGSTLTAWAQAIQNFENVNPAYNNPGGINAMGDAGQTSNGIAMYSSWSVGYNKLLAYLQNMINKNPAMTLNQATKNYAFGPNAGTLSPQNAQVLANYQASVSQSLGLDGSTPISWIGGA
jgi:hypothetical protein